jgi:CRP-like cAMP-binding protein
MSRLMRKNQGLEPLHHVGWLSTQPADFQQWAEQVGRWKTFEKGQFVYHCGDPPDGIYGLASGGLQITFPLVAEEPVVLYRAEPGFWIGDAAELSDEPRFVTLMAASPSRLFHISSTAIKILLANSPEHWRSFYRLSRMNVQLAVTLLAEVLSLTVRARACRRLLALSEGDRDASVTQEELAKLLGVTRPTLRRCLTELEALKAIQTQYRKIHIIDRDVLAKFKDEQ